MTSLSHDVTLGRNEGIGSSDAVRIMRKDWKNLYLEKIGEAPPVDLSNEFCVQLGTYTEPFHGEWFGRMTGFEVYNPKPVYVHPTIPFMFAHLDRLCMDPISKQEFVLELKHSSNDADPRMLIEGYYLAQIAHQLSVFGASELYFSVILGNQEPVYQRVRPTVAYTKELLELESIFWWHVTSKTPPDILPDAANELLASAAKEEPKTLVNDMRRYDMAGNNEYASHAMDYLQTKAAHKKHEDSKKGLKELMPADASEVYGHGVRVKLSKDGKRLIQEIK